MKTKLATEKSPGIPGWKWASGLKPMSGDRWLNAPGDIQTLNGADMSFSRYPEPECYERDGWTGYIRRVRKTKPKKPKSNLPKARVSYCCYIRSLRRIGRITCEDRDYFSSEDKELVHPCAVIPCATRKEAAALVAKHNRSGAR